MGEDGQNIVGDLILANWGLVSSGATSGIGKMAKQATANGRSKPFTTFLKQPPCC